MTNKKASLKSRRGVKDLHAKALSAKNAGGVKGGCPPGPPTSRPKLPK